MDESTQDNATAQAKAILEKRYLSIKADALHQGKTSRERLRTHFQCGHNAGIEFIQRLREEGIVGEPDEDGVYPVIV